jgi:hypothetical protein
VSETLHEKYLPILRFARGERFFPMDAQDFLAYSVLRRKGQREPLVERGQVTASLLSRPYEQPIDVYVQSVPAALADQDVASRWGRDVFRALADASNRVASWQLDLARVAYLWLSPKTQKATQMFWWNPLVMPLLALGRTSRRDLPRLDLPPEIGQAAADTYVRSREGAPGTTYYYRVTRDAEYVCLQYWLFYAFNDWATSYGGMNDHEGDWEGLYLFFEQGEAGQPKEPPAYITFVGHHSRMTKPWDHPDVTREGTHPVAFVAGGSHATYPEAKEYDLMKVYGLVDYASGDGVAVRPMDWRPGIRLDDQPWAAPYLGTWGTRYWLGTSWIERLLSSARRKLEEFGLPGVSGPRGPRYTDEATERPNWSKVVDWAGIFDLQEGR